MAATGKNDQILGTAQVTCTQNWKLEQFSNDKFGFSAAFVFKNNSLARPKLIWRGSEDWKLYSHEKNINCEQHFRCLVLQLNFVR